MTPFSFIVYGLSKRGIARGLSVDVPYSKIPFCFLSHSVGLDSFVNLAEPLKILLYSGAGGCIIGRFLQRFVRWGRLSIGLSAINYLKQEGIFSVCKTEGQASSTRLALLVSADNPSLL